MFLWQLSLALGCDSPRRLAQTLRPSELGAWWALWNIEPWGQDRADRRAGTVAAVLANVHRDPKKTRPYRPEQFMPWHWRDPDAERADLERRVLAVFGIDPKALKKARRAKK